VVAFLEVRLVAVGGQQFGVGEVTVVADQGEAAVGGGVVGDLLVVDGERECEDRLVGLAVAGLLYAFRGWSAALTARAWSGPGGEW
jgi:hypothetical protein